MRRMAVEVRQAERQVGPDCGEVFTSTPSSLKWVWWIIRKPSKVSEQGSHRIEQV